MRIWFNHWFSTCYNFIDMLKEDGHYVIGTNEKEYCLYRDNADEFFVEPIFENDNDFLEWALHFAEDHEIELFFPHHHFSTVYHNLPRFTEIGVKVACEYDPDKLDTLQTKSGTAELLCDAKTFKLLDYEIVRNFEEFNAAYERLTQEYGEVCIKCNHDIGGRSYKKIDETEPNMNMILNPYRYHSKDFIASCLATVDTFPELLVMPYCPGPEISIDCLDIGDDFIAVPRYKYTSRFERIDFNEELLTAAVEVQSILEMEAPYNIQFRYRGDELYFMEVNTRLAGGSWKERYTGYRLPNMYVDMLAGKKVIVPPRPEPIVIGETQGLVSLPGNIQF